MEFFAKIVTGILQKSSIADVQLGSKYALGAIPEIPCCTNTEDLKVKHKDGCFPKNQRLLLHGFYSAKAVNQTKKIKFKLKNLSKKSFPEDYHSKRR